MIFELNEYNMLVENSTATVKSEKAAAMQCLGSKNQSHYSFPLTSEYTSAKEHICVSRSD